MCENFQKEQKKTEVTSHFVPGLDPRDGSIIIIVTHPALLLAASTTTSSSCGKQSEWTMETPKKPKK